MKPPHEPPADQDVDDDWQRAGDPLPDSQSRSLWIDGRFYIDLGSGKLHMAIRSGSIVLAAADPSQQLVLDDILGKIVDYNRR
ncbi:MAG: hypothetical protein JOY64_29535 [Alphaproteobacteria bacterium]|nr:hypothetical protein [Alphaproteobacteria bacterium]